MRGERVAAVAALVLLATSCVVLIVQNQTMKRQLFLLHGARLNARSSEQLMKGDAILSLELEEEDGRAVATPSLFERRAAVFVVYGAGCDSCARDWTLWLKCDARRLAGLNVVFIAADNRPLPIEMTELTKRGATALRIRSRSGLRDRLKRVPQLFEVNSCGLVTRTFATVQEICVP